MGRNPNSGLTWVTANDLSNTFNQIAGLGTAVGFTHPGETDAFTSYYG